MTERLNERAAEGTSERANKRVSERTNECNIGQKNKFVEWCSVRPDSLINEGVSTYEITESPSTGLFNGQPTARSNVAHFMVRLIEDGSLWTSWRFRMPVIMNSQGDLNEELDQ